MLVIFHRFSAGVGVHSSVPTFQFPFPFGHFRVHRNGIFNNKFIQICGKKPSRWYRSEYAMTCYHARPKDYTWFVEIFSGRTYHPNIINDELYQILMCSLAYFPRSGYIFRSSPQILVSYPGQPACIFRSSPLETFFVARFRQPGYIFRSLPWSAWSGLNQPGLEFTEDQARIMRSVSYKWSMAQPYLIFQRRSSKPSLQWTGQLPLLAWAWV